MRKLENKIKYIFIAAFFAAFAFSNISSAQAGDISTGEVINLLNAERQEKNLSILSENSELNQAAQMKAEDMIKNDYFAHNSPQGRSPWHWFEKSGYDYKFAGENLAVNYSNAKEQHEAWMNSPTHRDNILNANYREVGVAVLEGKIDGARSILTVQLFGAPMVAAVKSQKAQPAAPEPVVAPEVKSAEISIPVAADVPAENLPIEKVQKVVPIKISAPVELPAVSWERIFGIIWLATLVLLYLAIFSNSLVGIGKGYELIYETFKKKEDARRILVHYEGLLDSIKINMQHAGSTHPARGRPG